MINMNLDKALKMRDREIVCSKERKRERERAFSDTFQFCIKSEKVHSNVLLYRDETYSQNLCFDKDFCVAAPGFRHRLFS